MTVGARAPLNLIVGRHGPLVHRKVTNSRLFAQIRFGSRAPLIRCRRIGLRCIGYATSRTCIRSLVHSCSLYLVLAERGPVHEVLSEPSSPRNASGVLALFHTERDSEGVAVAGEVLNLGVVNSSVLELTPNPSIERTVSSVLRTLPTAAHFLR